MKAALLLGMFVTTAWSQPAPPVDKPDAKSLTKFDISKVEALFDKGTKHYDLGEWDAAIAAFKQAYAQMPDSSFLFNLGQAYRQKGSCREATAAYKSYLRNATDDDRAKAEQFIRELDPCVKIEEEKSRRLLPPPPPPRLTPRDRVLRRTALIGGSIGLAALGGSAVFAVRSLRAESDLEKCNVTPCSGTKAAAIDKRGRSAERTAKILGIAGGTTFVLSAVLFTYTRINPEYITVTPTSNGMTVSTTGRF